MDIVFDEDIETFLRQAAPWLLADEAINNLMVGLCRDIEDGRYSDCTPLLVRAVDESELVAPALQTPPHGLPLSRCDLAWAPLTRSLAARRVSIPGVLGPAHEAEQFAESWVEQTGVACTPSRGSRIFELAKVRWPKPAPGEMLTAVDAHRRLVRDWTAAFRQEAIADDLIPLDRGHSEFKGPVLAVSHAT
jgi:hypothetical protein